MASEVPPPSTMTVSSLLTTTRRAVPSNVEADLAQQQTDVRVDHLGTGHDSQIIEERLAAVPEERRLTATAFRVLRMALTTSVDSASPSTSLGNDQQRLCRPGPPFRAAAARRAVN